MAALVFSTVGIVLFFLIGMLLLYGHLARMFPQEKSYKRTHRRYGISFVVLIVLLPPILRFGIMRMLHQSVRHRPPQAILYVNWGLCTLLFLALALALVALLGRSNPCVDAMKHHRRFGWAAIALVVLLSIIGTGLSINMFH